MRAAAAEFVGESETLILRLHRSAVRGQSL